MNLLEHLRRHNILTKSGRLCPRYDLKLIQEFPELLVLIHERTSFLQYNASLLVKLLCIQHGITEQPTCDACGAPTRMFTSGRRRGTFPTFCSSKCSTRHNKVKQKRKQTNMIRYGSTNYLTSSQGKHKTKTRIQEKYNVDNAAKNDAIKHKRQQTILTKYQSKQAFYQHNKSKRESTCMERYGVKNAMSEPLIQQKREETCIERYGVPNPWQLKTIQQKRKRSMQQRHGVEYPLQSSDIRKQFEQTLFEKYRVSAPLQSSEFQKKQRNTTQARYGIDVWAKCPQNKRTLKEKRDVTMITKYGCASFMQSQIPSDVLVRLNDESWMREQHITLNKPFTTIARELNIAHSTVGIYMKKHNIPTQTNTTSWSEREVLNFIRSIIPEEEIKTTDRSVIPPLELDVFIPSRNLAIEYNGLFFHSEHHGKKSSKYHLNKTKQCEQCGIRLIHIFEHEWINHPHIVKSRLQNVLGKSQVIYGRKCTIQLISNKEKMEFLTNNHIQGDCPSSVNLGLIHDDVLVGVMTFGKSRFTKNVEYELIRYCCMIGTTIIGGPSKLFKHFVKTYHPTSIVSYSDKRWNTGKLYSTLGFVHVHDSSPNYFYFKPTDSSLQTWSRNSFQKHKLQDKLSVFDPTLTEWKNMLANGYDRFWDCGNAVFMWRFTS